MSGNLAFATAAAALAALLAAPALAAGNAHRIVSVQVAPGMPAASGRLLLFVAPAAKGPAPDAVDAGQEDPSAVYAAAQEVGHVAPGGTVEIDADTLAFPSGFSKLPAGDYVMQAVLDVGHTYAYAGRGGGDLTSDVIKFSVKGAQDAWPTLTLSHVAPPDDPWVQPARVPEKFRKLVAAAKPDGKPINFLSPMLSHFWGRPVTMHGWVLLPPSYKADGSEHYPTVFYTHGFGGSVNGMTRPLAYFDAGMRDGSVPPMIFVFLDQSGATGTTEFVDSFNNGPWGLALTTELIPALERQYRMDGNWKGRFLLGHSSGGWATLWLQTHFPETFGGTWSGAPDPSDFHEFTNVDLYAPHANVYRKPDGTPVPLVRMPGHAPVPFESFAKLERVLGEYGGQMSSFEWVFSPRGPDGRPLPMFDRDTGDVDPRVVAFWHNRYDIAFQLVAHWGADGFKLNNKIHVIVGTADTFYLDQSARRLQTVLDNLHAKTSFRYVPGRSHFDLYQRGDDPLAMVNDFTWEMYQLARPGSTPRVKKLTK